MNRQPSPRPQKYPVSGFSGKFETSRKNGFGVARSVVAQQLYNLLATRIEDEYLEFAQHTGIEGGRCQSPVHRPQRIGRAAAVGAGHPAGGVGDRRVAAPRTCEFR